jgi:hypothetical protein
MEIPHHWKFSFKSYGQLSELQEDWIKIPCFIDGKKF